MRNCIGAAWTRWCLFLAIAAVTVCIYRPAIYHTLRADQWFYVGYATQHQSWWSFMRNCASYTRIAELDPGDTELFRPLLNIFICTELQMFGYNFAWWQLCGIAIHLAAVFWLLKVLWTIRPGMAAAVPALFFASLHIVQPTVIWHHINAYMLYVVFLLVALHHVYCHACEGQRHKRRLWLAASSLMAACFTFEAGTAVCVLCAVYLWCVRERQLHGRLHRAWPLLMMAPALLYVASSYIDFKYIHPVPAVTLPSMLKAFSPARTAWGIIAIPLTYMYAALFPLMQSIEQTTSVYLLPFTWNLERSFSLHKPPWALAPSAATAGIAGCIVVLAAVRWRRLARNAEPGAWQAWCFAILCCGAWSAPVALIVVGRATTGSVVTPLERNLYYSYLILPFVIVAAFSVCRAVGFDHINRSLGTAWQRACISALLVLAALNGWRVYATNAEIREKYPSGSRLLARCDEAAMRPRFEWEYFMQRGLHSYWSRKDATNALIFIHRAVQVMPTNPAGYLCRGALYENLGCYTNALDDFATALQLDPSSEEISNRFLNVRQWLDQCATNAPADGGAERR